MTTLVDDGVAAIQATFPQLVVQFVNYGAGESGADNVVYITNDPTYNKIDVQIALNTGSTTLAPGKILDPATPPGPSDGTVLYVDLTNLQLNAAAWKELAFTSDDDNWTFQTFPADQAVGMTPKTKPIPLKSGAAIAVHMSGLLIPQALATPSAQLYMTYYNVPGVTGAFGGTASFAVMVQNPPTAKSDLTQVLSAGVASRIIINSYDAKRTVNNNLTLQLSQASKPVSVKAGPNTVFTVSFVYGKPGDDLGYGALTDINDAINIVPTPGDNVANWVLTSNTGSQSPNWTLQPPNGAPIVGTGAQSVASVLFGPIVTRYQPGPTVMLVAYTGVPGYADGSWTVVLDKIPHVIIDSISVDPNPAYFDNKQASVVVSWQVRYATSLELTQNYQTTGVTNLTSSPATLNATNTLFTLKATGPGGDLDNVAFDSRNAIALPVINSFIGAPTEIYAGTGAHDVRLDWAVDTTGQVALSSTAGTVTGQTYDPIGGTNLSVSQPQMLTLQPIVKTPAASSIRPLTRSLIIGGFNTSVQNQDVAAHTAAAAASPSGPFIALVDTAGNRVIIVDTVQYSWITTVQVGAGPTAVALSDDGSLMVTANGDKTLSIVPVSIAGGVPSFGTATSVKLQATPGQIAITPDNSRIYVTTTGAQSAGQLIALVKSGNTYAAATQVAVGNNPQGLAVEPSGARIFVANKADNTISIIGVGLDGSLMVTDKAQNVATAGGPVGLAISTDGKTLLATCPTDGTVVLIETNYPNTGTRQPLTVGSNPIGIAMTPTGAYAFVANQGDGTVSLLDVWPGTGSSSVLQKAIKVGSSPSGVAISPDGLVVLVPNSGGTAFSIVTLQTYALENVATQVGSKPTDVVTAPDGQSALIWHDAFYSAALTIPGVRYFATNSGVVTSILNDVAMVQCVFAPDPAAHRAFAIGTTGPGLYVIDLSNPQTPQVTEQRLLTTLAQTRGLAISGDGNLLFVLVVDRTHKCTLLVGTLGSDGTWTQVQSLPLYTGQYPGPVLIAASPDAATLFIADSGNGQFVVLTRITGQNNYQVTTPSFTISNPVAIAVLPDGSRAYVVQGGSPCTIVVIDLPSLAATPVTIPQSYVQLQDLVPSPDGRRLIATDSSAGALRILDPESLRILQSIPLSSDMSQVQGASGAAIAMDGSRIFVANTTSNTASVLQQVPM